MNGSGELTGAQIDALISALMDAYSEVRDLEYMLEVRLEKLTPRS